jgi:transcriptional regulator with XRE-family HTH domain
LREWRRAQNLSQQQLAAIIGVDKSLISKMERRRQGCALAVAVSIEELTRGKVRCKDLMPPPVAAQRAK